MNRRTKVSAKLEPNFVPATKRMPFMNIISATETCTIDLEGSIEERFLIEN